MEPIAVLLPAGHVWLRVADASWEDPLDPSWAMRAGGRWNPPGSFPVLYLNEDLEAARAQLRSLFEGWPVHPEDLREDVAYVLVLVTLPARQEVSDALSDEGLEALGLPRTYPSGPDGTMVERERCQSVGALVHEKGFRGVWCRSAKVTENSQRLGHPCELAWFPAERGRPPSRLGAPVSFRRWWAASSSEQILPSRR